MARRRIPWIKGFLRPSFSLTPPELRLDREDVRRKLFFALLVVIVLCFGGVIYLATQNPPALIARGGVPAIVVPGLYSTSIAESVAAMGLFILGILGLWLLRTSVRIGEHIEARERYAWLGIGLLLVSIFGLWVVLLRKLGRTITFALLPLILKPKGSDAREK